MTTNASTDPLVRRVPFFYGWVMVANMFSAGMASSGPTLWAFSVFVHPMTDELGWSRGALFGALTLRSLMMGLFAPIVGRFADNAERPKAFMILGGTMYALGLALISIAHSILVYYLVFVLVLGMGMAISGGYARTAYVSKWFVRKRGRAITMGTMGSAMAAFVYPLFTQLCIDAFGWRTAWIVLGATSFFFIVPFAFLIRRQPEDVGLLPDGDTPEQAAEYQRQQRAQGKDGDEQSYTVKDALHMPTLWILVACFCLVAPGMGGINATWVPHFQDIGISANTAATSLTVYGAFSIIARFFWGYWVDHHHVRKVLIAILLLYSLAMFFLLNVSSPVTALVYSAFQGLITGGWVGINPLVYPTYFGRRFVGAIQGTVAPLTMIASAAGPFMIATVFDMTGSYRGAYTVMMFTWLIAAGLMFLARPPGPRKREEPVSDAPRLATAEP